MSLQKIPFDFETIVINDGLPDETEALCQQYVEKLNLKYIFSGHRNTEEAIKWRVPGFAINIAAQESSGDILILSCAEMFHVNNTITRLTEPVLANPKLLGIPFGKDDRDRAFLDFIQRNNGTFQLAILNRCADLDTLMPFLMAINRDEYFSIGGYDEDFTGIAYDDRDLVDRLLRSGCQYYLTEAVTVHLYHPRTDGYYLSGGPSEWDYNKNLFFSRQGKIIRNEGREWGKL